MKFLLNSKIRNVCKVLSRSAHLEWSPNANVSKKPWDRYANLLGCKVQVTYVWIDGTGDHLRSRMRTLALSPSTAADAPNWDFDGSATYLAEKPCSSDVLLSPVAVYKDPILQGNARLVLCETFSPDGKPTLTNHRLKCSDTLGQACKDDPMFGFEQMFFLMDAGYNRPLGWPVMNGEPCPLSSHYCGVGAQKVSGRLVFECIYKACLYAGIDVSAGNPKITPGQFELALGPSKGMKAADDVWMARYIMQRVAEDFGIHISFTPSIVPHWPMSKCHVNFSTKCMREDGGIKAILAAIKKMEQKHAEDLKGYGVIGKGRNDVPKCGPFKSGIGDRTACVRISTCVAHKKKGHFQDRRPQSNSDPYRVINTLVRTVCL